MKRLAAVAAAVAMIAGAWALRAAIEDRDTTDKPGTGTVPDVIRLTCATELEPVCRQIETGADGVTVKVEDPGVTADRVAGSEAGTDPGFDAWLTDGPWAEMVADDRTFNGLTGSVLSNPSEILGRSPALIALKVEQQGAVESSCGGSITWQCIGEQAPALRVGLSTPDRGDGLVALAEATAGFFDTTRYSALDFQDPEFTQWFDQLTGLSRRIDLGRRSALAAAVGQAGTFNVVGALEAESVSLSLLSDRSEWTTIYPEPMSTADVQLVPRAGLDAAALLDRLGPATEDALSAEGWRVGSGDWSAPDGAAGPAPAGSLPADAGLPSPGVLNALRDLW